MLHLLKKVKIVRINQSDKSWGIQSRDDNVHLSIFTPLGDVTVWLPLNKPLIATSVHVRIPPWLCNYCYEELVLKSVHMRTKRRHLHLNPTPLLAALELSAYFNSPSELKRVTGWKQVNFRNSWRPSPGGWHGTADDFDFAFSEGNSTVSSMSCAPRIAQNTLQGLFILIAISCSTERWKVTCPGSCSKLAMEETGFQPASSGTMICR